MGVELLKVDFYCFYLKVGDYEELVGFFTQSGRDTCRFDVKVRLIERNKTRQKAERE